MDVRSRTIERIEPLPAGTTPAPLGEPVPCDGTRRWLHDHTLQMLEYIAADGYVGVAHEVLRKVAVTAADELRDFVEGSERPRSAGIVGALLDTVAAAQVAAGALTIRWRCDEVVPAVDQERTYAIVAATHEALANARKHAGAANVLVTCAPGPDGGVDVTIADDGRGFDPAVAGGGTGLRQSIVRRMLLCGGSAVIHSAPGAGTTVTLSAGGAR